MTIVMIGQKGLPARSGGIERHVESLATGLVTRHWRVIVFGRRWYVENRQPPPGVEQVLTGGIHTKHLDAITHSFTALWAARRFHPDIVHLHGVGVGLLTPWARLILPRAKVIVTFHCLDRVFSKWGWFARLAFRVGEWCSLLFAHRTITVSQHLLNYCLETYGCQTSYVSHPFRATRIAGTPLDPKFGLQPGRYLLFVGRLLRHKGAHVLIDAYRLARELRPAVFGELDLAIVGSGSWTDDYVKKLDDQAEQVPGVKLFGEICGDELKGLQANALAHVFPTWEEGLSLAALEAGISGRPVVATDIPPNREALGGHFIAVRPQDIEDLARGLIQVASQSEEERQALAERARTYIAGQFDFETVLDRLIEVYREVRL